MFGFKWEKFKKHFRGAASARRSEEAVGAALRPAVEHYAAMDAALVDVPPGTDRFVGQDLARLQARFGSEAGDGGDLPASRRGRARLLRACGLQHAAGRRRVSVGTTGTHAGSNLKA